LTAWCGYQAARWGGEQAAAYSQASAARIRAAQLDGEVLLFRSAHVGLFVEYVAALSEENQQFADFLYQRFPAELKTATDAWLATEPLTNPDAPATPFVMPEYRIPQQAESEEYEQLAEQKSQEAAQANQRSDDYVLLTVLFATVLFFGGISGKFQWRVIDAAILTLGTVVFLWALWRLLTLPVH
jgi:hypothetical protein